MLYLTRIPRCEKYKTNVSFYGSRLWNQLAVIERKLVDYNKFIKIQRTKAIQ